MRKKYICILVAVIGVCSLSGCGSSAKKTEECIFKQADSLEQTIIVFADINNCVDELVTGLQKMLVDMRGISDSRNDVEDSIRIISAVSQEVAASTSGVTDSLNEQVLLISRLTEKAEKLARRVNSLEEAMSKFKIENTAAEIDSVIEPVAEETKEESEEALIGEGEEEIKEEVSEESINEVNEQNENVANEDFEEDIR